MKANGGFATTLARRVQKIQTAVMLATMPAWSGSVLGRAYLCEDVSATTTRHGSAVLILSALPVRPASLVLHHQVWNSMLLAFPTFGTQAIIHPV